MCHIRGCPDPLMRIDPIKKHALKGNNPSEHLVELFIWINSLFLSVGVVLLGILGSGQVLLNISFSYLPGNFALKNGGDFWLIFSALRFPRNETRKLLKKFRENSEQTSGQNPGQKFKKFGELSFCHFSDLKISKKEGYFQRAVWVCHFAVLFRKRYFCDKG